MENMNTDLKEIIAKNIIKYRKALEYTQAELAEKLNYSDKTLSKWERAESIPDVITLKQLADLFGVKVDDLLSSDSVPLENKKDNSSKGVKNKTIVAFSILSQVIVWAIATVCFTLLTIFEIDSNIIHPWIAFIYAMPVIFIIMFIFTLIWGNKYLQFLSLSAIIWTVAVALHLSFIKVFNYMFLIYIVAIPLQILAIVFFFLIKTNKSKK